MKALNLATYSGSHACIQLAADPLLLNFVTTWAFTNREHLPTGQ